MRAGVGAIIAANPGCDITSLLQPERYPPAFELGGASGRAVIQGFAVLFLMWNASYPLVLLRPAANQALFALILVQQLIRVAGESWIWMSLPV